MSSISTPNSGLKKLFDELAAAGYTLERGKDGNAQLYKGDKQIRDKKGRLIQFHTTPSDTMTYLNHRTFLQREGILSVDKKRGNAIAAGKQRNAKAREGRHIHVIELIEKLTHDCGDNQREAGRIVALAAELADEPDLMDAEVAAKSVNRALNHPEQIMPEARLKSWENLVGKLTGYKNHEDMKKGLTYKVGEKRRFVEERSKREQEKVASTRSMLEARKQQEETVAETPERPAWQRRETPEVDRDRITQAFWFTLAELRGFAAAQPTEQRKWLEGREASLRVFAHKLGLPNLTKVEQGEEEQGDD